MNFKQLLLFCVSAATSLSAIASQPMVKPAPLQPGDTIAIISPASCPKAEDIEAACEVFRSWGYVPVKGPNVLTEFGTFAGTIEQRLSDLKWAFETPGVKAIVCGRGGYGSVQLLCLLPDGYFAEHPKWLAGYSDITAIHGAMSRQGVMSIHSHMCGPIGKFQGTDTLSVMLHDILRGKLPVYKVPAHPHNQEGCVKGTLIGGNLTVINDMAATRYDLCDIENPILFIEDVNENLEAINRGIYRLKCAGVLDRIRGLVVGSFTHADPNPDFETADDVVHSIIKEYNIPVCYGFPVGHIDENVPLIEGAPAMLSVTPDGAPLRYLPQ